MRLESGTIAVLELLSSLRGEFELRHHPDYRGDWDTLSKITTDYKSKIETELPSGFELPQEDGRLSLQNAIVEDKVTVVHGGSGSGKSALVKAVLDQKHPRRNQVWFGPDELTTALSAAKHTSLRLEHELSDILRATVEPENVLVIDSAERIGAEELIAVRNLIRAVVEEARDEYSDVWRVIVVTQTQGSTGHMETLLAGLSAQPIEVEALTSNEVKLALNHAPGLGWLTAHDDTVAALTNLRTLAWVCKAGSAFQPNANELTSHVAVSDRLWKYWTKGRADVQAMTMRLAQREASFERSFALSGLDPTDTTIFAERPDDLPLRLNDQTNRIEFEHDLAADWARYQFLKQICTEIAEWVPLASNPLWTNALRMLGQLLLRQTAGSDNAWDAAFKNTAELESQLAGDILLDALCLDTEADRFLAERVDLLLDNGAKQLERLLRRFHHLATLPIGGGETLSSEFALVLEERFRSIIVGRWPPILRFLVAHRVRLKELVSPALARVIETWLTKTPHKLGNGGAVPFREELARIALDMARTVQVEKGQGIWYIDCEPELYTAALAGAEDLPTEVGQWALELAGRRQVDTAVRGRIREALEKKAKAHVERLRTDPVYRARHEERQQIGRSIGSFRQKLLPWPLGARHRVDQDFRDACIKSHGLQHLINSEPELAGEVLLALIIEDEPERDYGSGRIRDELGLEFSSDAYPTIFWKSPFFHFLQSAPEVALTTLISLVNFCTERWIENATDGDASEPPCVTLEFADGSQKAFMGWWQVYDWPQSNDFNNSHLYCALDALERWLTMRLDNDEDITNDIEKIFSEGNSAALVRVLVNVAKYRPLLLTASLSPLMTFPDHFDWDRKLTDKVGYNFDGPSWARCGDAIFEIARDWTLAPHRQRAFIDVVIELLLESDDVAIRLQNVTSAWSVPSDPKVALEYKLLFASLDRSNYRISPNATIEENKKTFEYPEALRNEIAVWEGEHAPIRAVIFVPLQCEKRLVNNEPLSEDEAKYLRDLLHECATTESTDKDEADAVSRCRSAAASTLICLGEAWLSQNNETQKLAFEVLRAKVSEVATSSKDRRDGRMSESRHGLEFIAHAVMHLWLTDSEVAQEWEKAVLLLLTSGDAGAALAVVGIAYSHREELGEAWWRLLQAGLFWAGLKLLAPRYGDDDKARCAWNQWLAKLRRYSLRGFKATHADLDFKRIAQMQGRLDFRRRLRLYEAGDEMRMGKPTRDLGGELDSRFLSILFGWLIEGEGTGSPEEDESLLLTAWDYEASRAEARRRDGERDYDLPSSQFGYSLLTKLAAMSAALPQEKASKVWEAVISHGPAAHYALRHFIRGLFQHLADGDDPAVFERTWRAVAEYGLASDWSQPGLWFYGERLVCDLMGFGNEKALMLLNPGASMRMSDVYERWATTRLDRDEESVSRFCYFLVSDFGSPIRLDGLRWIAASLNEKSPSGRWYRDGTGDALVELLTSALAKNTQSLQKNAEARQALFDIAAMLVSKNVPSALALQERIKSLQ